MAKLDALTTTCDLKNLIDGSYYFVRVFAENEFGLSKRPAEFSEAILVKKVLSKY